MGVIHERENNALNVNPPSGDQYLTVNGSDWLWAATAVYCVSFVSPYLRARQRPAESSVY
jgi:bacteriorhodopsin